MPRSRTQKQVARRINIFYFRDSSAMRNARRALIVLCTLAAIAWIGIAAARSQGKKSNWLDPVSLTALHNPGHLARPHARFENDCRQCHTGACDSAGHYLLKVTDDACLQCHDGAIHRDNQKKAPKDGEVSRDNLVLAISDEHHPGGARSAGCVECHTEHRGDAALLGIADNNCVVCHRDLSKAAADASKFPESARVTTAFELDAHPRFGRALMHDKKIVDPTKVKFNHKFHYPKLKEAGIDDAAATCVFCHSSGTENKVALRTDPAPTRKAPPYDTGKVMTAARNGDSGYMMPVSYAADCAECHAMNVGDLKISHIKLADAAKQLATLSQAKLSELAVMSDDDRKAALAPSAAAAESSSGSGRRGRGKPAAEAAPAPAAAPMSPNAWLKKNLDWVQTTAQWIDGSDLSDDTKTALKTMTTDDNPPTGALMDVFLAYAMDTACAKCHDVSMTKADDGTWNIDTVPTGITSTPRHWFAASRFDHRPHRDMACVDCHAGALQSGTDDPTNSAAHPSSETSTADFLSPDLDGTYMGDKKLDAKNTCIHCHTSSGGSSQAVASNCISCHVYHDRTKERMVSAAIAK
jgi:hypothetical protein